ncbi:MAG: Stf0 sulfotransferase family protein [Pseudomonadales bacterium]|nr:Stf0 sulfotransferase family protein [Pseudomonadales bacterium]NRA14107.1 sulfotransferase [Oceanospirillaceae bacterium]
MIDTYILCATPRTGSTLLCEYLTSTQVAGKPHSFFRSQDMLWRARQLKVLQNDDSYDFHDYLTATREFTSSNNGVFGLRIMWETLAELLEQLQSVYPEFEGGQLALLEHTFGRIKFVYLHREDVLGQAVSLWRAQQANYWHSTEEASSNRPPEYDFSEIASRVEMLRHQNNQWRDWFDKICIDPLEFCYEELAADPASCTKSVLNYLHLDLPAGVQLNAPNQRLADHTTLLFKQRFERENRAVI